MLEREGRGSRPPPPTCPPDQHYDSATGKCVDDSPPIDPCTENPTAEGCEDPDPIPNPDDADDGG